MNSTKASIRLFKSPVLEALTHVHPSLPFIIWIPVIAYFLYQAFLVGLRFAEVAVFFGLGMLVWTLVEYIMHRYVFHFEAKSRAGKYLVFLFHGIHHDDAQDATRLVMPPAVSIFLATGFYYLFLFLMGAPVCNAFFPGFLTGYLIYDYLHFAIHHFKPRTAWGRRLKEHHMKHHYATHGAKWGVSSPLWDRVFGTME